MAARVTAAQVNDKVEALSEQIGALVSAISGGAESQASAPEAAKPATKVRKLASLHPVPDTSYGLTPEPRESGRHVVSVIALGKDGAPIMSAKTGAPRKPIRIPVEVARYLTTDDGRDALEAQVDSLA